MITQPTKQSKRYLPHELTTKINPVKLYRQTKDIDFVIRRYHISKASLMRWNKLYDVIQTDNGGEFTHTQKTSRVHPLDVLCNRLHITHKTIRPKTPWHNGKVERSYRNDQERFYNHLSFYSYEDLQIQMKRYLRRSNLIPMSVLGWKSPIQKRQELEAPRFC